MAENVLAENELEDTLKCFRKLMTDRKYHVDISANFNETCCAADIQKRLNQHAPIGVPSGPIKIVIAIEPIPSVQI